MSETENADKNILSFVNNKDALEATENKILSTNFQLSIWISVIVFILCFVIILLTLAFAIKNHLCGNCVRCANSARMLVKNAYHSNSKHLQQDDCFEERQLALPFPKEQRKIDEDVDRLPTYREVIWKNLVTV